MAKGAGKGRLSGCDVVRVETADSEFEGMVMPSSDERVLVLKLASGYNVGIERKNIVKQIKLKDFPGGTKECETTLDTAIRVKVAAPRTGLPTIAILHTGGTINSQVDYETGGVVARFTPEELLAKFPELQEMANITSRQVMNMMSEDMRFSHYKLLARAVHEEIKKGVDGIIIGHGTDTIAVTAAALAFMLEHVSVPVILVGAQRSSDRGSTDARLNMLSAAYFIMRGNFRGVALCMHETSNDESCVILPATKTKKLHTSRRDAFKAVNATPIARVQYAQKKIDYLHPHPAGEQGTFSVRDKFEDKVAIVKTYPNMFSHFIDTAITKGYKGLVLEGSGIGQAPTNIKEDEAIYRALQKFITKGGIVVLTSNCIFGEVHPYIYKNCRRLDEIGVVFGGDMLTETAFVKLAWLLGNYPRKDIPRLLQENLRGELSHRSLYQ